MKNITNDIKSKINNESGLVIVEATIIFPIMFFVIFFIIFFGNTYHEKSKIDNIVNQSAIKGAQMISDPLLGGDNGILKTGSVPNEYINVEPYRYLFGGGSAVENKITDEVKNSFGDTEKSFFKNMSPKIVGSEDGKIAKFNNYVLYSTFSVSVRYQIKFPIRFIWDDNIVIMELDSRSEVAVSDVPEFIRNVDMVMDMYEGSILQNKVNDTFKKIKDFLGEKGFKN